jgi:hypothetical protein
MGREGVDSRQENSNLAYKMDRPILCRIAENMYPPRRSYYAVPIV